jgi:NitT/TauT family transport system substrate-binding protein
MKRVSDNSTDGFSRRRFLANASAVGAIPWLGLPRMAAAEPPPEIRKIRLAGPIPIVCTAPQLLAEELLHLEGFSEVEYVSIMESGIDLFRDGRVDMSMWNVPSLVPVLDAGHPIVILAGIHPGCWELFGNERVRAIRDLKGKNIAIHGNRDGESVVFLDVDHSLIASILAYVGIDPQKDVNWVLGSSYDEAMHLFVDGKADAYMAPPPRPQELGARKIGHVIVNGTQDRPWSQYYCCVLAANQQFVDRYPVATKRAVRAFLKATDICSQDPERVARHLAAKGWEPRYEVGLEVLNSISFKRWREVDPEDTVRFFALRLHEVGMIKSTPQKIIDRGTDWRFLNELKRELKA